MLTQILNANLDLVSSARAAEGAAATPRHAYESDRLSGVYWNSVSEGLAFSKNLCKNHSGTMSPTHLLIYGKAVDSLLSAAGCGGSDAKLLR